MSRIKYHLNVDEVKRLAAHCYTVTQLTLALGYNRNNTYFRKHLKELLDTHDIKLTGERAKHSATRPLLEYLVKNGPHIGSATLKRRLIRGGLLKNECSNLQVCGVKDIWCSQPIILHLDHKDGDKFNNELRNLRLLCPNCHSQTETYCGKNLKGKTPRRSRIFELEPEELVKEVLESSISAVAMRYGTAWETVQRYLDGYLPDDYHFVTPQKPKPANPGVKNKRAKPISVCKCGNVKTREAKQCYVCAKNRLEKINWPSDEELIKMIQESNFFALGKKLGVSDNAIRKRLRVRGLLDSTNQFVVD